MSHVSVRTEVKSTSTSTVGADGAVATEATTMSSLSAVSLEDSEGIDGHPRDRCFTLVVRT
jgi:hypothetical protein